MRIVSQDDTNVKEIVRHERISKVYNYFGQTNKIWMTVRRDFWRTSRIRGIGSRRISTIPISFR